MSITILGLPQAVFWFWFSAFFFLLAIVLFLEPLRQEKNELMSAFFAFLVGMGWLHLFAGAGVYWSVPFLIYLGFLGGLTGVAYTLKFPLLSLSKPLRKPLFYLALAIAWSIIAWLLIFSPPAKTMIWVTYIYMITVSGVLAGLYMIWEGLKAKESWAKVKIVGGGLGVLTCCLAADILVLYALASAIVLPISGHFFMALAPIILITAVYWGRYLQRVSEKQQVDV